MNKEDLHLFGLTSIFIASKLEDLIPIRLGHIVRDAAHNKYKKEEIRLAELEIYRTLSFRVYDSFSLLDSVLDTYC